MEKLKQQNLTLFVVLAAIVVIALPSIASAGGGVTTSQLRACHDYVWFQSEFKDMNIPNAGISISGGDVMGNGNARVHWVVKWEGMRAHGVCIVNRNEKVVDFKSHYNGESSKHSQGAGHSSGIYYNTYSRRWYTSDGQECATCTPENGFKKPVTDGEFYYDPDIRKWRNSGERGAICHTCTPENGFPIPAHHR